MKKRFVFSVILVVLLTVSAFAQESIRKYDVKSGIITRESTLKGVTAVSILYFDDYGSKTAESYYYPFYRNGKREYELVRGEFHVDGKTATVDYVKLTRKNSASEDIVNYMNLSEEVINKYKIKKIGEEEVCGKPCVIYSLQTTVKGIKSRITQWVWMGIPLKRTTRLLNLDAEQITTDIQTDVPVDSIKFVIPDYPLESK